MAHFAELDENGIVVRVVVVDDQHLLENGQESEERCIRWCEEFFGGGTWVQTSYNFRKRKNFAGVGHKYDAQRDAFIPPKVYDSWSLNEETCQWDAPIERPKDGKRHEWDEKNKKWVIIQQEAVNV